MDDNKINPDHIRIENLSSAHEEIIKGLQSYEQDLVDFLLEDALKNQEKKISKTYLWFLKSTNGLIGYITLLTDRINLDAPLKKEFREKDAHYKSLPALKIGRLCVDDRFLRKGIGRLMIQFIIYQVIKLNERCGCRFITLDAKRNPDKSKDSLHFYKKMGFEILKEREKGATPMYKDVFKILEAVNRL
jgi:GNAT superfamily N-acetyltransferase